MEKAGRVALAEMVSHNQERLVLIRPAKGGLVLQVMFYADEVRDFTAIPRAEGERLTPEEFELATGLVEKLSSDEFQPKAYKDEHRERVLAMLDEKQKGRQITTAPYVPPSGRVVDLFEALKQSMNVTQARKTSFPQENAKRRDFLFGSPNHNCGTV